MLCGVATTGPNEPCDDLLPQSSFVVKRDQEAAAERNDLGEEVEDLVVCLVTVGFAEQLQQLLQVERQRTPMVALGQ